MAKEPKPPEDEDEDGPVDDGTDSSPEPEDEDDSAFYSNPDQVKWHGPGKIEQDKDE